MASQQNQRSVRRPRRVGVTPPEKMKTTVPLSEALFKEANAVAKDIGVSRSRFLEAVLEDFLRRWRPGQYPERPDPYIAKFGSGLHEEGEPWPEHRRKGGRRVAQRDERRRRTSRQMAVALPADLLERVEAAAKEMGVARDDFVNIALSDFLVRHNSSDETRQLNRYYIKHPPEPDPFLDYLALEIMKRTEWKV
jgi:metal-responsive CopG/Arc/MetJ family transcriptional regulator